MSDLTPPHGFAPHFRGAPAGDEGSRIYSRVLPDRIVIGFHVGDGQTDSRGVLQTGLVTALADNAMGLSCVAVLAAEGRAPGDGVATVSMSTDFIGTAKRGQWVMVDTQFVQTGETLCFAQAFVTADGVVIARTDARFRVL